ncbi:MAG: 2-dehydropantoate 2-reductase [Mariprofundus sp.]|nr:2-dehydropantoate 2-reductase [Mariprofundus sp.]
MKIGFAGAGAIGCHYGSKLQQAGFDVLLLARGKHLSALQRNGLRHESDGETQIIPINTCADITHLKPCQIIIISCKMTGLTAMLSALQGIIQPDTMLVSLQNGVEAPDRIAAAFAHNSVVAGTAFIGARLERPGHVIHSAAGGIRLGLWQQGSSDHLLALLIEAFQHANVAARIDADPAAMLWRKLLWNCGFNAITAITRRHARDMAAHADTLITVQQAMQETVRLAQTRGINIGATDISKHIEITLAMGPVKTSMWQDIEAGRPTEVDYINGYVATQTTHAQSTAPVNQTLTSLIHAIEARHDS